MAERIEDMKLTYQPFYRKFKSSPESVFELPRLKKFLNDVIIAGNDDMYQGVKLMRFDAAKQSLQNSVLSYVKETLMSLFPRFGALTDDDTEGFGIDKRAFSGDTLLHDVCSILDTRNWILPEGMIANFEDVQLHLMKVFESANRIYDRYEALLLEVCPEISRLLLEKELTSIIIYTINSLSNQTLPP